MKAEKAKKKHATKKHATKKHATKKHATKKHATKKHATKKRAMRGSKRLERGDYAKLLFTDGTNTERMWVRVGGRLPVRDAYWGALANEPLLLSIRPGARVNFPRSSVLDVLRRKDAAA